MPSSPIDDRAGEAAMTDGPDITLDEVRARIRATGLPIPEERLGLVHGFLRDALRPIRALDSRAVRTVEPAVTFDAAGGEATRGR
jgi:hypothetical protein